MEAVWQALCALRAPISQGEYDLHRLVEEALTAAHVPWEHEVQLAPRCRIDLTAGRTGIEIKRGKPPRGRLLEQLGRYAACAQIDSLIVVSEGALRLPATIHGKPVKNLCLNRLWGIAL